MSPPLNYVILSALFIVKDSFENCEVYVLFINTFSALTS